LKKQIKNILIISGIFMLTYLLIYFPEMKLKIREDSQLFMLFHKDEREFLTMDSIKINYRSDYYVVVTNLNQEKISEYGHSLEIIGETMTLEEQKDIFRSERPLYVYEMYLNIKEIEVLEENAEIFSFTKNPSRLGSYLSADVKEGIQGVLPSFFRKFYQ
jgi:hypothetical protein